MACDPFIYFVAMQEEALFQFPMLKADGLKGAVVYYDAQQNDSRMNVLIVLTGMWRVCLCVDRLVGSEVLGG